MAAVAEAEASAGAVAVEVVLADGTVQRLCMLGLGMQSVLR